MRNQIALWNDESWGPFRLATGFDRLWDELVSTEDKSRIQAFTPACDVHDTEGHYLVSLDVPGVAKEDIHIEVKDNQLWISGERKQEESASENGRYFVERSYGKFQRAFTLGRNTDSSKIEAAYKDGVLRVVIPKAEAAKPKTVEIKVDDKPGFFEKFTSKKKEEKPVH